MESKDLLSTLSDVFAFFLFPKDMTWMDMDMDMVCLKYPSGLCAVSC